MSITVQVEPGYRYEITRPEADAVEVEAHWVGGALVAKGAQALSTPLPAPGPLAARLGWPPPPR